MPEGVYVELDGLGDARISFPDRNKMGPALAALIATGAPIEQRTGGARREFIVPEGNAREAGLLDEEINTPKPQVTHVDPADRLRRPDHPLTQTTAGLHNDSPEDESSPLEKEAEIHRAFPAPDDVVEVTVHDHAVDEPNPVVEAKAEPKKSAPAKKAVAPAKKAAPAPAPKESTNG